MRIRKPLFAVFALLYVLILPFLISYALGYDLVGIARGRFVRTGGVFVASTPPRARFTLDGKEQPRRTPLSVISLPTGIHSARLELDGFRPWVRSVRVRPGEVTIVDDALLIPEKWPQRFIATTAFADLWPEAVGPYLLFRKGPRLRDLWLYDVRGDTIVRANVQAPVTTAASIQSIHTQFGSASFLLEVSAAGARRVLRGRVQWPTVRFDDVTRLFPAPLVSPQWSPQDSDTIYTTRKGRLYQVRLSTRTARPYPARLLSGFTLEGRQIYGLDQRMNLWKIDPADGEWQEVHTWDAPLTGLPDRTSATLSLPGSDLILAKSANGELVAAWPEASFRASDVIGFGSSSPLLSVLAWQKPWMVVATLVEPQGDAQPAAPGGTQASQSKSPAPKRALPTVKTEWIPSRGGEISQAWFVYGVTHVLYHGGDQVTLHAPSHDGQDFNYWVANVRGGTSAWYSGETGRVYYIDRTTGKPAWTQVVAQPQSLVGLIQEIRDFAGATGGQ
ncbi:MAG TPA: PEGA domain-containing protein [Spirochaetia bacterium]